MSIHAKNSPAKVSPKAKPPKCCGNCRWWKREKREAYGDCLYPIPEYCLSVVESSTGGWTYIHEGKGCAAHAYRITIERIEGKGK